MKKKLLREILQGKIAGLAREEREKNQKLASKRRCGPTSL